MSALPPGFHPARLAACFRAAGASEVPAALASEPRFAARLSRLVARHYSLSDAADAGTEADRALCALPRDALEDLGKRAGAVLRAREILQEIRGPVIAALIEGLGAEGLDAARRHADLAADRPVTADLEALLAAVTKGGRECLGAWIASLPAPLSRRVALKWPDDAALPSTADPVAAERGPAILRRLAPLPGDLS